MDGYSIDELEDALSGEGWEPEYKDAGEVLDNPSFELSIDLRTVYVEVVETTLDGEVVMLRICEFDENGKDFLELWDVEEVAGVNSVISEVKEFLASI